MIDDPATGSVDVLNIVVNHVGKTESTVVEDVCIVATLPGAG